jgi:chromate transporter
MAMPSALREVAGLFLKLGFTAFGGPAAHIAMMHNEVVVRRKWLTEEEFLDLLGATNLIPGPNSTEMAIHISYLRAGWAGLVVGGLCFIMPAMSIVLALAWAYVQFGAAPQAAWLLYGVKPVVIAVIGQALWSLAPKALRTRGWLTALAGAGTLALYFLGINEILLLAVGGVMVMIGANLSRLRNINGLAFAPLAGLGTASLAQAVNLPLLFFIFLKIGSILYGSGYVLLAFLRSDLVVRYGWLTDQQLLDAIAVGQVTPGPVFTTATFIGYVLAGLPGALLATLGIFLPSFIFVALSSPLIPRMRKSVWVSGLLDGVNAASLGLMAAVTVQLGVASLTDWLTVVLFIVSTVLLIRYKLNATWLIAGGAVIGLAVSFLQ